MIHRTMYFGLAALVALATTPAAAGSACCACTGGCATAVEMIETYQPEMYIVDHGPVYSGPGHYLVTPTIKYPHPLADYPYVGQYYYPPDNGPAFYPTVWPRVRPARPWMHRSHISRAW